jgi:hypothetical protein
MNQITLAKKLGTLATIACLGFAQFMALPLTALAAGPVGPTGVQGPIGPQTPTGPQVPTGVQGSIGPQEVIEQPVVDLAPAETPAVDPSVATVDQAPVDLTADSLAPIVGDSSLTNDTTGSSSINDNTQNTNSDTTVDLENDATVNNDVNLNANSGANEISQNTSGGNISTGDLNGSINLLNVTNSVFAPGSSVGVQSLTGGSEDLYLLAADGRTFLPTNSDTGSNSSNANTINGTNVIHFITGNTAEVDNDVTIVADTGNNSVTENTSLGDFMTGSIDMALNLVNLVNLQLPNLVMNLNIWSIFGDVNGNLVFPTNSNTGSNSINTNTVNNTNNANLDITQTANIDNAFDIGTNTGGNTLDSNSVVGDVATGDVNVKGGVTNIANSGHPVLYLINVMGKWFGQAFLPGVGVIVNELGNDTTGANSENANTVDQTNTVDATVNQTANVRNNINMDLNTGNNTVARNTKVGDVSTGSINVMANVVNFVNSFGGNLSEFSLGIVNVFGNWFGSAKSPATAQTASIAGSTTTSAPSAPAQSQVVGGTSGNSSPDSSSSISQPASASQVNVADSTLGSANQANSTSQASTQITNTSVTQSTSSSNAGNQLASAQVLGASNALTNSPQVAGTTDRQTSQSLPWIIVGVALLSGWIFIEIMAARALKAEEFQK